MSMCFGPFRPTCCRCACHTWIVHSFLEQKNCTRQKNTRILQLCFLHNSLHPTLGLEHIIISCVLPPLGQCRMIRRLLCQAEWQIVLFAGWKNFRLNETTRMELIAAIKNLRLDLARWFHALLTLRLVGMLRPRLPMGGGSRNNAISFRGRI